MTVTGMLYGQLAVEPTAQPTNLIFSDIGYTKMTLSFTPSVGGADGYLILKAQGSVPPSGIPVDGTQYTLNQWFVDAVVWRIGPATSFQDSDLAIGAAYSYAVFAYNGSVGQINYLTTSPLIGTQATLQDVVAPVITLLTATPNPAMMGDVVTVSVNMTDNHVVYGGLLEYRTGLESDFYDPRGMNKNGDVFSHSIPGSAVSNEGLFFRITAVDPSYNYSSITGTVPISTPAGAVSTLSPEGGAYPIGFPADQWRMFSVPLKLDDGSASSVLSDFGKSGNSTWKLFDGNNDVSSTGQFKLGQSFWLKQLLFKAGKQIALGSGRTASASEGRITLRPGWNQIANPFTFPIDWVLDTDAGNNVNIKGPIAYDGTKYIGIGQVSGDDTPFTELKPWDGYWVYNAAATDQLLTINPSGALGAGKYVPPLFADDWNLQIKVKNGSFEDQLNYVGVALDAAIGEDRFDLPELPTIGDFVSVAFDHRVEGKTIPYSIDYLPSGESGYTWDMSVTTNLSGVNSLSWIPKMIPSGCVIRMMNVSHHEMVEGNEYCFRSEVVDQPVRFKIWIGSEAYVSEAIMKLEDELPNTMALHANFPNPFNPSTIIKFDVARSGPVKLKVYNILGQEIITLVDGYHETGKDYSVAWNGKDAMGRSVASGVYIYRLVAGRITKTRKMLLLK